MLRTCLMLLIMFAGTCWSQLITAEGPDECGYTWISSRHPLGPAFCWESDVSEGPTIPHYDTELSGPYTLPFSFPFYGSEYTQVWVSPGGLITFASSDFENVDPGCPVFGIDQCISGAYLGECRSGSIHYRSYLNRWVIEFSGMHSYGYGDEASWQLVLYPDGTFSISHLLAEGRATCAGWQNAENCNGYHFPHQAEDRALPDSTTYLAGTGLGDFLAPDIDPGTFPDVEVGYEDDYLIQACITDYSGVQSAWLIWCDDQGTRDSLEMSAGEESTWSAQIPRHEQPGWIRYQVGACDESSHQNQGFSAWQSFLVQEPQAVVNLRANGELNARVPLAWDPGSSNQWNEELSVDFEAGIPEDWVFVNTPPVECNWRVTQNYHVDYQSGESSSLALRADWTEEGGNGWFMTPSFRVEEGLLVEFDLGIPSQTSSSHGLYIGVVDTDPEQFDGETDFRFSSYSSTGIMSHHTLLEELQPWYGQEVRLAFCTLSHDLNYPLLLDNIRIHSRPDPEAGPRAVQYYEILRDGEVLGSSPYCHFCDSTPPVDGASYQVRACYDNEVGPLSPAVTGTVSQRLTSGGPDTRGYLWVHSDAPEGPAWSWWDGPWAEIPMGMMESHICYPSFQIPFYGVPYDSFRVTEAGALYFGATGPLPQEIPFALAPNGFIAALASRQHSLSAYICEQEDRLRIEFRENSAEALLQLELDADGAITWYFGDTVDASRSLVGIEDERGLSGLQIHFMEEGARIAGGVAIRAYPDLSLDLNPPAILTTSLPEQCREDMEVDLSFHIVDLESGVSEAWFHWTHLLFSWPFVENDSLLLEYAGNDTWSCVYPLPQSGDVNVDFWVSACDHATQVNCAQTAQSSFLLLSAMDRPYITISQENEGLVEINWTIPTLQDLRALSGYRLYKDGLVLQELTSDYAYTDTLSDPYVLHHYAVSPVYEGGEARPTDPVVGQSALASGPDPSGYTWRSSDQEGGPQYEWYDISSIGTECTMGQSRYRGPYPLSFSFPFYDEVFDSIYVCSSGVLLFEPPTQGIFTPSYDDYLPNGVEHKGLIAGYWETFDPWYEDGAIYYYSDSTQQSFTVAYHDVCCHPGINTPHTFEMTLFADGRILMQYAETRLHAPSGIESPDGWQGLCYSRVYGDLHDELAVLYSPGEPAPLECDGQTETEPNQGWNDDPATSTLWDGGDTLCGDLLDDNCDCYLIDTGSSMYLRAVSSSPGMDCRLVARSLHPGGWELRADTLGKNGHESLVLEGIPAPFYLCIESDDASAEYSQYEIALQSLQCDTPCNTATDLGVLNSELLVTREAPVANHFDLNLATNDVCSAGHDDWFHFSAGFTGTLNVELQATGLGNEVLGLFSGCNDAASQLLLAVDEEGYDSEHESLQYEIVSGEEYWLLADFRDTGHASGYSLEFSLEVSLDDALAPTEFALLGVSPNPFNPVTHIRWLQPMAGEVQLRVWNLGGQLVDVIRPGTLAAGEHQLAWDGSTRASGLYFYRLEAPGGAATGRMLLLK